MYSVWFNLLVVGVTFIHIDIVHGEQRLCPTRHIYYYNHRTCGTWCWSHHTVRKSREHFTNACCTGWTGSSCNTPICNPPCNNGGRCSDQHHCICPGGRTGSTCSIDSPCSFRLPCFPGHCRTGTNCRCIDGYGGHTCLDLYNSEKPSITECTSFLMNKERATGIEKYRFKTYSTMPGNMKTDEFWVPHEASKDAVNYVNVYFEAMYTPRNLPSPQAYIRGYGFGIVSGRIDFTLYRPKRKNEKTTPPPQQKTQICSGASSTSPEKNIFSCNKTDKDFGWLLEHGDRFQISVHVQSGGYRDLTNTNYNTFFKKEIYTAQTSIKIIEYKFDYKMPYHCQETRNCSSGRSALTISQDITKVPHISLSCNGWKDDLSGISTNTYQVFRLIPDTRIAGTLTEEHPQSPSVFHAANATTGDRCAPFSFTPPFSGMYSVLLGVADKANNTKYARRLFLFDNTSSVTLNDQKKLYVSSAVPETGSVWQNNLQTEQGTGNPIQVTWKGHFVNRLHETGHFLDKVQPFKPELLMNIRTKYVNNTLDDHEGKRSVNPITNIHGIVRFEIAHKRDKNGGKTITSQPTTGWTNVLNILLEKQDLNISRSDGDSIRLWVKAYDIMGNINVTSTLVNIDSSPPHIDSKSLEKNINGTYPFTSRINLQTLDRHSGIHQITWKLVSNNTNETLFHGGTVHGNSSKVNKLPARLGYCIPTEECFYYSSQIEINNCWFVVDKDLLDSQVTDIHIDVYNMAMLKKSTKLQVSHLMSLHGMEEYSGPMNLRITETHANSVRLRWDQGPSCYQRSAIMLKYNSSGSTKTMDIHKNANYYDLSGLNPETAYSVQFFTEYGSQRSDPVHFSFVTGEKEGLSSGVIAGISIVIIILVGLLIAMVILWRTGKLNKAKESIYGHIERRKTRRRQSKAYSGAAMTHSSKSFDNNEYIGDEEDDVYLYGNMNYDEGCQIDHTQISLIEKITTGRFADIFKASYKSKKDKKRTVVAKVMKENWKEDDEIVMKAKINFFASKVGIHSNIVGFIGGVTNNSSLGPYMVLEYCETGTLRNWLQNMKSCVTESTVDALYRFTYEISKGMNYLASKQIVHRRLAARNIYLTSQLEVKISGFGPDKETEKEEPEPGKERVPVKWIAPECIKTQKNANSKSDVWSFGIVAWEIFSFGETPYPGIKSREVPKKVESGYVMARPEFSSDIHYELMKKCWQIKPEKRPSFQTIANDLGATFNADQSDGYYYAMNQ